MAIINKELAIKIAEKLGAEYEEKTRHTLAVIKHNGIIVAHFGIRRGSDKDLGHDYVPEQIHLSTGKAKILAQCRMTPEQWIAELARQGYID
jgi:hypothetical protein